MGHGGARAWPRGKAGNTNRRARARLSQVYVTNRATPWANTRTSRFRQPAGRCRTEAQAAFGKREGGPVAPAPRIHAMVLLRDCALRATPPPPPRSGWSEAHWTRHGETEDHHRSEQQRTNRFLERPRPPFGNAASGAARVEIMQTIVMPERASGLAWLEHFPEEGGSPEKTTLDRFPFVIGRSETADLQVGSSRVSREHAVLVHEEREYRVRDLGSTNGTFVNGQRIEEAVLHHGDLLVIANVEFNFGCGRPEVCQKTVTQLLDFRAAEPSGRRVTDLRHEVRRLHEMLARGCVQNSYDAIVSLSEGRILGHEARGNEDADFATAAANRFVMTARWPVAARVRQLRRVTAVEGARGFSGDLKIFVHVDPCDFGVGGLTESIGGLRHLLADGQRLIVVLPYEAMRDVAQTEGILALLRQMGIGVALDGFTGKGVDLPSRPDAQFDYLKLAGPLVRGIQQSPERQRWIQAAVRAGRDGGWEVIATGIRSKEERSVCDGLGCSLGQGPLFATLSQAGTRPKSVARAIELDH
jgi:EAL domain-containing protein (putative c-di-GMP-specific phosphodiesterase class I)